MFTFLLSSTRAGDWNLPWINLITRQQRWANESWRYATLPKSARDKIVQAQKDAELQFIRETDGEGADSKLWNLLQQRYQAMMATDYLTSTFPDEQSVDEIHESYNGNYLKWPESIHNNKTKIVIHHTAEDYTKLLTWWMTAVKLAIQNIYKYHAITKGWWDVGYNFFIDPFWNIYEWRAGGEGTVWAHAAWNNTSTIWIALMGNFNIQEPTDEQLKALVTLSTVLAKKYNINPAKKTSYFKPSNWPPYIMTIESYVVAWHKDDGQATACPGTNLYKLLPEIRKQIKNNIQWLANFITWWNNTNTIVLTWFHYWTISKLAFILPIKLGTVTWCKALDTGFVVESCAVKSNGLAVSLIRKWITSGMIKRIQVTSSLNGKPVDKIVAFPLLWKNDVNITANDLQLSYAKSNNVSVTSTKMNKISYKINLKEIKSYLSGMINVLLYDLSINNNRWEINCDGVCKIIIDNQISKNSSLILESYNNFLYLASWENYITPSKVEISSLNWWEVKVVSYNRKSYGGTPRNTFHWSLIFKQNPIRNLISWNIEKRFVIINRLAFNDYMKGIAETSDTDNINKQILILLLAKMYSIFYLNNQNVHPSIPVGANYTAIDNPDMFQKYVWAWWEKTSKMSSIALNAIKNTVILYSGYVPILPYFSCSAWFTWSAKDKWWWQDTPYLQSRIDFDACFDFKWHGVGLSGKWAQYLAQQWRDYKKILEYYYPWVEVKSITN